MGADVSGGGGVHVLSRVLDGFDTFPVVSPRFRLWDPGEGLHLCSVCGPICVPQNLCPGEIYGDQGKFFRSEA